VTPVRWTGKPPGARFTSIVALGVCGAVAAGLVHYAQLLVADWGLGTFRWFSREFFWMAPVAYGLVIVPGTAVLGGIAMFVRRPAWYAVAAGCIVTVAGFGILLPVSQLSRAAALLLAAGAGVQAARLAVRAPERWTRVTTRVAAASLVALPAIALLHHGARAWGEARAVAALADPRPGAPNVLLVVLDAARARSLGFVNPRAATTPRLDTWAPGATVFERAFAVAPWTLPSHASMMSGRYAGELAADWTVPIGREHPVLPELLRDAGYATAGFVANLHYTAWDSGLDRGFLHYDDYQVDWAQTLRSSSYTQTAIVDTLLRVPRPATLRNLLHPDLSIVRQHRYRSRLGGEVIDAFLAWRRAHDQRPFFALLNLMDPHLATLSSEEDRRRYPHDHRGEPDYLAAMRYLDVELDRMLSTLQAEGQLDNTIVLITADHGELLGEHGLEGHARSAYRDVLHVPLLVRFPGRVPAGARVARAVSLRDLPATILDLAGLPAGALPGTSLAAAWRDSAGVLSPVLAEVRQQPSPLGDYPTARGDLTALADERWYYIRNHGTGQEELFSWTIDTAETVDHARGAGADTLLRPWRSRLQRLRGDKP
jgi:arylsulfatase A-like enzyme